MSRENRFEAVPELPETDVDLSVVVSDDVPWTAVERVASGADKLIREVSYVDEYRGSWVPEGHRSLTLRVVLRPTEATLTAEETGVIRTHAGNAQPGTACPPAIAASQLSTQRTSLRLPKGNAALAMPG